MRKPSLNPQKLLQSQTLDKIAFQNLVYYVTVCEIWTVKKVKAVVKIVFIVKCTKYK